MSMAVQGFHGPEEKLELRRAAVARAREHGGVHDHELAHGIDVDALSAHAEKGEERLVLADEPGLVAVAIELGGDADLEVRRVHAAGLLHPRRRNDLPAVELAVVGQPNPE